WLGHQPTQTFQPLEATMTAMMKTFRPVLLGAAALLTGTLLLATSGYAGNSGPIGTTTGVEVQSGTTMRLAPLKCERTSSPSDFPYAKITNVSGGPIKK